MAVLIQFDHDDDCEQAIDLFAEAQETYHSVPRDCFLVSDIATRSLTAAGIRFRIWGVPETEEADRPMKGEKNGVAY